MIKKTINNMENKINVAELLKDCPKGMELDCLLYDNVTFERFDVEQNRCYFKAGPADTFWTTCYGKVNGSPFGKCIIFPKGKTTWEGFIPPIQPKFKSGDKVKRKDADYTYIVTIAKLDDDYYDYVNEDGQCGVIHISTQDDWELLPNKFDVTTLKPFESKVLVRDTVKEIWKPDFFGCLCDGDYCPYMVVGGIRWKCCIPFEGNEHLLGKTNDCNEYYKNW